MTAAACSMISNPSWFDTATPASSLLGHTVQEGFFDPGGLTFLPPFTLTRLTDKGES